MTTRKTPAKPVESPRGINWMGILLVLTLVSVLFVGCTGTAAYIGLQIYDRVTQSDVTPKPVPADQLAKQIKNAGVTQLHAIYFAKVCVGIANRLEVDGRSSAPIFDQRKEAVDLVGTVGSLAIAGNDAANYQQLPAVITQAFQGVWESGQDGKLKAGPLTEADRKEVINRWRKLADAFSEAAK
jgi:hypothetical protein